MKTFKKILSLLPSILCFAGVVIVVASTFALLFTDERDYLLLMAGYSAFTLALLFTIMGLAFMPRRKNETHQD